MTPNPRQIFEEEEPLIVPKDYMKNRTTTPAFDVGTPSGFGVFRQISEGLKEKELPFLPETSPLRYLPAELAGETFKAATPQNLIQAGMMIIPLGAVLKPLAKTPIGKIATKEIGEVAPKIFKGFTDLSTKLLECLLAKSKNLSFFKRIFSTIGNKLCDFIAKLLALSLYFFLHNI